ncbi:hypothetical protein PRZ48_012751 [Zasmidium cellare]|uniref:Zn(2)-C6 fungal-type domain-containing protein n=1 Tax=Zasmidium cellare TaxID=395010 RepID=A0ABR0E6R1_ZASCE|nr:hypothetical protein PRZ48_012751 [Zasmidium cellare]
MVKCDNQRPICGRCSRLQRPCTGYRDPTDLIIVQDESQSSRVSTTQERSPRSASIADRESVSRSRYVPPQHYTACQKLPWMRRDLPNELRPRLHDIAVSRFFAHYVLYPNRHIGDDGYLPDLPYFYSRSSDGSTLQSAVRACALASYANASRQSELSMRACRAYGQALDSLKGNIMDAAVMKRDDTLMSVLVLDFYAPIETLSWFDDTAPTHIEARLGYNGCRIIKACRTAKEILSSKDRSSELIEMIEQLHTIAIETSAWPDLLPDGWLPLNSPSSPQTTEQDTIGRSTVQYNDIWIANTWNCHRTYEVHLHETLFECYSHLPEANQNTSVQDDIRDAVRRLNADMLDSVPFLLGTGQCHPELGSFYALGVTECVEKSVLASEEQREVARRMKEKVVRRWKGGDGGS